MWTCFGLESPRHFFRNDTEKASEKMPTYITTSYHPPLHPAPSMPPAWLLTSPARARCPMKGRNRANGASYRSRRPRIGGLRLWSNARFLSLSLSVWQENREQLLKKKAIPEMPLCGNAGTPDLKKIAELSVKDPNCCYRSNSTIATGDTANDLA